MTRLLLATLLLATTAGAQGGLTGSRGTPVALPFPSGQSQTINIVNWDANSLPKLYERSDQLPLTNDDVAKMSAAGFDTAQLVKMIEERRCACDASADGLIALKKSGVAKEVLSAVSLHSLAPHRQLNLVLTLDFAGDSKVAREAFLYVFVDDGPVTRVLTLNLEDLLGQKNDRDVMVDRSDLLIQKKVRRITLSGALPLTTYGKHRVMVVASANPSLTHPSQLKENERKSAQSYEFDYPRSSIQNTCTLTAGYQRDAVLNYKWNYAGSRFECEWN